MGDDYFTMQVYAGQHPSTQRREHLIQVVQEALKSSNFAEKSNIDQPHNRIIVIGPLDSTPWLSVFDSITYEAEGDFPLLVSPSEFWELAKAVSTGFGPAVIIHMDDSCSIAFRLFVDGQLVDEYQDKPTIGWAVSRGNWSEAERKAYVGHPEIWISSLGLQDESLIPSLRQAWPTDKTKTSSTTILADTAKILGWNGHLCSTGFSIGADGIPYPYQAITSSYFTQAQFLELYFLRPD